MIKFDSIFSDFLFFIFAFELSILFEVFILVFDVVAFELFKLFLKLFDFFLLLSVINNEFFSFDWILFIFLFFKIAFF